MSGPGRNVFFRVEKVMILLLFFCIKTIRWKNAVYFTWIYLVPDCANEYDFIDFAKNEEGTEKNKMFDATVALFKKLWEQYASKDDGLYIGNKTY